MNKPMSREEMRQAKRNQFEQALSMAHDAAKQAQAGMVEDTKALDCGFAWVTTHDPSFNTWARKRAADTGNRAYYGAKATYEGWQFWKPGGAMVQAIGIHEAGAKAFREVLARALNIRAEFGSRYD